MASSLFNPHAEVALQLAEMGMVRWMCGVKLTIEFEVKT